MRKRIVIAAVTMIATAGGLILFLAVNEGSIEEHKAEYIGAFYRSRTWMDVVRSRWRKIIGQPPYFEVAHERTRKRIARHEKALIKLGYLRERTFVLSRQTGAEVFANAMRAYPRTNVVMHVWGDDVYIVGGIVRQEVFAKIRERTNTLVVVGREPEIEQWEKLVQQFDVPE